MPRLIACPECGSHVRTEAACPHCGAAVRDGRGAVGVTATALLMGLALAGCEKGETKPPEPEPMYGVVAPPDADPGDVGEPEYGVPADPGDVDPPPPEPDYGVPEA